MSKEAVQAVISQAVSDEKFREALFANPDQALQSHDLTDDEIAGLKTIDAETMQALSGDLDERISKAFVMGWTIGGGGGGWFKKGKRIRKPVRRGGPLP